MNEQQFCDAITELGISSDSTMIQQLEKFYQLLFEWNQKMNLTRIVEKKEVYLKHFYDSLTLSKIVDLNNITTLCDVGSGAGFPGIVLKIFYPHLKITLLDSLNKRVLYLNEIIRVLQLKDIVAIHTRAEDFSKNHIEVFDCVTARAVAHLRILTEMCIPMIRLNGYFLVMKGTCQEELEESKETISVLGAKINRIENFFLPFENSSRTLIQIEKLHPTDRRYPRSIDKIKKIPLKKNR